MREAIVQVMREAMREAVREALSSNH